MRKFRSLTDTTKFEKQGEQESQKEKEGSNQKTAKKQTTPLKALLA